MDKDNIIKHLAIGFDILFVILALLKYFNYLSDYWNLVYIFYFVLAIDVWFFTLKISKIPEHERDKHSVVYLSKYFFLLGLVVIVVNQFLKRVIINDNLYYIVGLIIALGFITFYSSRDRVEKKIENEKQSEDDKEAQRKADFKYTFPRINKIWGLRSIVKWMYKEGWWYSVGLILIVVLGFLLRVAGLFRLGLGDDEFPTWVIGQKFFTDFNFLFPSGQMYDRAYPDIILRAIFGEIFGQTIFVYRFVSVLLGVSLILFSYLLAKRFLNKNFSLILSLLLTISAWLVNWSKENRMYAFLILVYFVVAMIFSNRMDKGEIHFRDILVFIFLFPIMFFIHQENVFLIIIPFFYLFYKWKDIFAFLVENKNVLSFVAFFVLAIASLLVFLFREFLARLVISTTRTMSMFSDVSFFIDFFKEYYLILFILSICFLFLRKKNLLKALVFIPFLVLSLFLGWQGQKYILFIFPLLIFMAVHSLYSLTKIKKSWFSLAIVFLLFFSIGLSLKPLDSYGVFNSENNITYYPETMSMKHPDNLFLANYPLDDCSIVGTQQFEGFYFYNKMDYLLRKRSTISEFYFIGPNGENEYYLNATIISDFDQFTETIKKENLCILGEKRFTSYYVDDRILSYVMKKCILLDKKTDFSLFFCERSNVS